MSTTRKTPRSSRTLTPHDGAAGALPLTREVVLVVEDERMVRLPICRALRRLGYFVLEATDGEDALRAMQEYHAPIHLVISDVRMPGMDGAELIELLRGWYPQLRVLFMSGYGAQAPQLEDGRDHGTAFLAKPFAPDVLAARVRWVLDME